MKANLSKYVASEAASYAATFNPMGLLFEPRAWIDADGNRTIFDANGNIQKNEVIGGTANFGQSSSALRPGSDLARGYNWECSVSVRTS